MQHFKAQHFRKKRKKCSLCLKKFNSTSTLNKHQRRKHGCKIELRTSEENNNENVEVLETNTILVKPKKLSPESLALADELSVTLFKLISLEFTSSQVYY